MKPRRIGLLGGTFDPIHHGHLLIASDACEVLRLDRLLFVPAAVPPHKRSTVRATAEDRWTMLEAAIADDPRFGADDLELRRGGPSFTVDTLRAILAREPGVELVFLLGVDQFRAFATWRRPEEVARLATLGVMARSGETPELSGPYRGVHVPVRRVDISSTEIRDRCAAGRSIRYLVPEPVRRIIEDAGLYRNPSLRDPKSGSERREVID